MSADLEMGVLGRLMLDADAEQLAEVAAKLRAESFDSLKARIIFRAMARLAEAGRPIDGLAIADELTRAGEIERVGGLPGLALLLNDFCPPRRLLLQHVAELARRADLRRLSAKLAAVKEAAEAGATDAEINQALAESLTWRTA